MAVTRIILALALALAVAGCGIKKPLMRPKEIPEYERKRAEKLRSFEEDGKKPAIPAGAPIAPAPETPKPAPEPSLTPILDKTDVSGPTPMPKMPQ